MKNVSKLFEGDPPETQKKKKTVFYAACATLALLAVLLVLLVVALIPGKNNGEKEGDEPSAVNIGALENKPITDSDLSSIGLLPLDTAYDGTVDTVLVDSIKRPQKTEGGNVYTIGKASNKDNEKFCGQQVAVEALNTMIADFYKTKKDDNLILHNACGSDGETAVYSMGTAFELRYFSKAAEKDWNTRSTVNNVETYKWLYTNASKYGFVVVENKVSDGDKETDLHNIFRYVGVAHATAMKTHKLSVVEYVEKLKNETSSQAPLSVAGAKSAVYYVDKSNTETHMLPTEHSYTVCSDGANGYIVTVDMSK